MTEDDHPTHAALASTDPRRVGDWLLEAKLGAGGMGTVYMGVRGLECAAIKVVHPALAQDSVFRQRFRREIGVTSKVRGPHVARLIDADPDGDPAWLAIEFVGGPTLDRAIRADGPLTGQPLHAFAGALISALQSIHAAGVVHRDLKPSNVVLTPERPVVIDFGIASAADETGFTKTGTALGSVGWMAPEQIEGRQATSAADVYAWAATVAFASSGRPPFGSGPAQAILYRAVHHEPDLDGVDPSLADLVRRSMAKDAAARPTLDEIAAQLCPGGETLVDWVTETWVAPEGVTAATSPTFVSSAPQTRRRFRRHLLTAATAAVVVAFVAIVAVAIRGTDSGPATAGAVTTLATDAVVGSAAPTTTTPPPTPTTTAAPTTTSTTTTAPVPTTPPATSPPAPAFESSFGASSPEALELLRFAEDHELEAVVVNATINDMSAEDLYRIDANTDVLYVPGTCAQYCEGDAYELLFRDLDAVPDASVYYDSGGWKIKGRFVVNSVEIQNGGIYSIVLRAVPIA